MAKKKKSSRHRQLYFYIFPNSDTSTLYMSIVACSVQVVSHWPLAKHRDPLSTRSKRSSAGAESGESTILRFLVQAFHRVFAETSLPALAVSVIEPDMLEANLGSSVM